MNIAVYLHYAAAPLPVPNADVMARARLHAPEHEWIECGSEDEFLRRLPECEAAAVWYFRPEWTALAKKLRVLMTPAAGRELVRTDDGPPFAVHHGAFHGELMAETVVGLMLAFVRGIKAAIDRQATEAWPRAELSALMRPLRGSRALILGFGRIGKWIGRLLKPFGVRLAGVNRRDAARPDYFDADDSVRPLAELDALLPAADHLILALPATAETDNLVDARRLALLPDGAYVYNVGRGNSLVAEALAAELRSGRLGGAGLDVYHTEPLAADSPLRGCPNAVLMPHVSAMAPNYLDLFFDEFIARLRALP